MHQPKGHGSAVDPSDDTLSLRGTTKDVIHTKREIFKEIHLYFDAIGFTSAFILQGKLIYQELKRIYPDIGWNEPLLADISGKWRYFVWQLDEVRNLTIPRWITGLMEESVMEMHIMCDVSKDAYGTVMRHLHHCSVRKSCIVRYGKKSSYFEYL